jgi:hypothetical protein
LKIVSREQLGGVSFSKSRVSYLSPNEPRYR